MEELTVPAGLQSALSEKFGGAGDPGFLLSEISLHESEGKLTLSMQASVALRSGGREKWAISLELSGSDTDAARPDRPTEAYRWLALMVQANVIEWWHTRGTAPNIPEIPHRIA
ncbi:hypothetical protein [Streptomyces melanogenes]|uniref:hypothetical protein n=1 Tax=Streptomyces melanogenes TaxID=67326 RepID=UPI00167C513B|nr:hypothetical protein [Streptomyces melanogenes]GGP95680.1 hypothetical protein GCM10010278_86680 [Streptomyces melanogenes]